MTLILATTARNAMADACVDLIDAGAGAGTIAVRTGTQPANPQTGATGTLLLTFTLNDPAFGAASNGVATLSVSPTISTTGITDGTAGWFRVFDSNNNPVFDGACGTSGSQLNLSTLTVSTGLTVTITSGTFTQPAS